MMKNFRMSQKTHTTKRWRPAIDVICSAALSAPGDPESNVDVGSGLAPKKNTPFTNNAPITKPPLGRALPVRGEHNQNDRVNSQAK